MKKNNLLKIGLSFAVMGIVSPIFSQSVVKASYVNPVQENVTNLSEKDIENRVADALSEMLKEANKSDSNYEYIEELSSKANYEVGNFDNVNFDVLPDQYFSRGKIGLTAKAGAKILKAGLNNLGKAGYENLAKKTGLAAVGLNWYGINKIVNIAANSNAQIEDALIMAFKSIGFNDYLSGVTARIITTVFF